PHRRRERFSPGGSGALLGYSPRGAGRRRDEPPRQVGARLRARPADSRAESESTNLYRSHRSLPRGAQRMITRLTLIHAMSPLHPGTGQSVGAIDLPIARERPTGIPLIPGSSIKGALRARSRDTQWTRDVFGPETAGSSD